MLWCKELHIALLDCLLFHLSPLLCWDLPPPCRTHTVSCSTHCCPLMNSITELFSSGTLAVSSVILLLGIGGWMICNHHFRCLDGNGDGVAQRSARLTQTRCKPFCLLHFEGHRVERGYPRQECGHVLVKARKCRQTHHNPGCAAKEKKCREHVQTPDPLSPVPVTE